MSKIISPQDHFLETLNQQCNQVCQIAERCLIPILNLEDEFNYHSIGTAISLQYHEQLYLLTASHVIPNNSIDIWIPYSKGYHKITGHNMRMNSKTSEPDHDKHDIVIYFLENRLKNIITEDYNPLPISKYHSQMLIQHDEKVAIFGFPVSRNKKRSTSPKHWFLQGLTERVELLDKYNELNYSPDDHLVIQFDKNHCYTKDDMVRTSFPDPYGLSGGGIWRLFGRGDQYNPLKPYFVGMVIEKAGNDKYLIGVKNHLILKTLAALEKHVKIKKGTAPEDKTA